MIEIIDMNRWVEEMKNNDGTLGTITTSRETLSIRKGLFADGSLWDLPRFFEDDMIAQQFMFGTV